MSSYLRTKYGLNQQEIAEWLEVSRSQVAHFERNTRQLPKAASEKHSKLLVLMAELEINSSKKGVNWEPLPDSRQRLKKMARELEFQKKVAAHKALKMKQVYLALKKKYTQTRSLMYLLEQLIKQHPKDEKSKDSLWLEIKYRDAEKRLVTCDEAVQLSIMGKIAGLEALASVDVLNLTQFPPKKEGTSNPQD